jgi:hypothetical protein
VEHVVAKGQVDRRQLPLRIPVETGQLLKQDRHAPTIGVEHVVHHVQPHCPTGQTGRLNVEQRPFARGPQIPEHCFVHRLDSLGRFRARETLQIVHGDVIVGHERQDLLPPVIGDDDAQHVVAPNQRVPRPLQPRDVQRRCLELDIRPGGDPAECERVGPTQPVRLLQIGQRERLEPRVRVRGDRRTRRCCGVRNLSPQTQGQQRALLG